MSWAHVLSVYFYVFMLTDFQQIPLSNPYSLPFHMYGEVLIFVWTICIYIFVLFCSFCWFSSLKHGVFFTLRSTSKLYTWMNWPLELLEPFTSLFSIQNLFESNIPWFDGPHKTDKNSVYVFFFQSWKKNVDNVKSNGPQTNISCFNGFRWLLLMYSAYALFDI